MILNDATRNYYFPLPFIDEMFDRLAGHPYFCFVDGYLGYNQIPIALGDKHKITFTSPFGTFAYKRMSFGLYNAPGTFLRCMLAIFIDFTGKFLEVVTNDFSIIANDFDDYLANLGKVFKRCEQTNLVLNWKKCHFVVREGIVLWHKVSAEGLEVDKAKIEFFVNFPPPTNVKGIRSFLGHG